jgi:leucyl/phenylalanyl-tRNA--protein transferase
MFHIESNASKVALVHLVERLRRGEFTVLDTQFIVNDHFRQFGVIEMPRQAYLRLLRRALQSDAHF